MDDNEYGDLIPAERKAKILERVRDRKSLNIKQFAAETFLHEATLRRDLNELERTGLIRRTHGGAVWAEGLEHELPLFVRDAENLDKKDVIGEKAAFLVRDGDTVFLDSSSTALRMIPHLESKRGLKIVTNGAKTAILLSKLKCEVFCTGGALRENSLSFIGPVAVEALEKYYVDAAFFSCRSLSADGEMTDANEAEAALRKRVIQRSRKSYLLIDSSKLNRASFYSIGKAASLTGVLCDVNLS
jgi:DeoR/GlpR family transcriptional regulator of sugar metabolism